MNSPTTDPPTGKSTAVIVALAVLALLAVTNLVVLVAGDDDPTDPYTYGETDYADRRHYQGLIAEAVHYHDTHGLERTVDRYSNPDTVRGEWFVVIYDPEARVILAHSNAPDLVGGPPLGPPSHVEDGRTVEEAMAAVGSAGGWVQFEDATGPRTTWAVVRDGLIFSSWARP
ncbi:MAG: hypothetical protein F4011_05500 [Acidimicrobiaceae bacterium]|nr:hypothetical protein [Acidimicrobiaceae bacterium]